MAPATEPELPDQLVHLVIRFPSSIPDLPLSLSSPHASTTLSLKQLVRQHLPSSHADARLRLIYAGKVLPDATPISTTLRLSRRLPAVSLNNGLDVGLRSKGKQPVRDDASTPDGLDTASDAKKYYVHCSLGDPLPPAELASEALLAESTELSLRSQYASSFSGDKTGSAPATTTGGTARRRSSAAVVSSAAAPQGFDRLLSSGFTHQEVASLRSSFQTNLSYTHTPDAMPSHAEMRALEDRWLDSTATDPSPALTGESEAGWGAGFAVEDGGLDDMLWGYLTGFFWPLGAFIWGFREEGVWSRRRQLAVVTGVVLNAAFGFMRWSQ